VMQPCDIRDYTSTYENLSFAALPIQDSYRIGMLLIALCWCRPLSRSRGLSPL
jgi:hypothetical protein